MEEIKVKKREKKTQGYLNQQLKDGLIPAICYSGKEEGKLLFINRQEFKKVFDKTSNHMVLKLLEGSKNKIEVIVKDVQYEPLKKEPIHVDFYRVEKEVMVKTRVPITLTGESIGTKLGGVLEHKLPQISIRALPGDIPHKIEVDTSELNVGDSIYVEDLNLSERVEVLAKPRQAVCACSHSRVTKMNEDLKVSEEDGGKKEGEQEGQEKQE